MKGILLLGPLNLFRILASLRKTFGSQNNESIAVKRILTMNIKKTNQNEIDKLIKAEVHILGTVRHKNILKLYCYLSNGDSNIFPSEYMPNANLFVENCIGNSSSISISSS